MARATATKEKHLIRVLYIFTDLVIYHHDNICSMQADVVLEKVLSIAHLDMHATGSGLRL